MIVEVRAALADIFGVSSSAIGAIPNGQDLDVTVYATEASQRDAILNTVNINNGATFESSLRTSPYLVSPSWATALDLLALGTLATSVTVTVAPPPPATPASGITSSGSDGASIGAIIGGAAAGACLMVAMVQVYLRRRRKMRVIHNLGVRSRLACTTARPQDAVSPTLVHDPFPLSLRCRPAHSILAPRAHERPCSSQALAQSPPACSSQPQSSASQTAPPIKPLGIAKKKRRAVAPQPEEAGDTAAEATAVATRDRVPAPEGREQAAAQPLSADPTQEGAACGLTPRPGSAAPSPRAMAPAAEELLPMQPMPPPPPVHKLARGAAGGSGRGPNGTPLAPLGRSPPSVGMQPQAQLALAPLAPLRPLAPVTDQPTMRVGGGPRPLQPLQPLQPRPS